MIEQLRRRFCVPYNGDAKLVEAVAADHADAVYEFYGSDDLFSSGRWGTPDRATSIPEVLYLLRGTGIQFNYLLNSVVLDDYAIRAVEFRRHLENLRQVGVHTVTCASPFLVDVAKELGFEVSTSLMQHIRSEVSVRHAELLGYDRIMVCEDELRNVPLISHIVGCTELPVEIIVDNCCLKECPFRLTHLNSEAIRHPEFTPRMRHYMSAYARQCKQLWHQDSAQFLMTSWVRPEELPRLAAIGVKLFKLGGRGLATRAILQKLQIYEKGKHDGFVLDYLKPNSDPVEWFGLEQIQNAALAEFFDFFFSRGCQGLCSQCRHCSAWAKKVVRMVPDHWRNRPITGGIGDLTQRLSEPDPTDGTVANAWAFGQPKLPAVKAPGGQTT